MGQNEQSTPIGLRRVRVAGRDSDGLIDIPAGWDMATAYNGLQIQKAIALTMTLPEPNRVPAKGDDRVYHTFQLPADTGPTGELRASASNMGVHALLTGTKIWGTSPTRKVGHASEMLGQEVDVILWGSQQAIDSDRNSPTYKAQIWRTYVFPNALATPRPGPMEGGAISEHSYSIAANDASKDVTTGQEFSIATMGFTLSPWIEITTLGRFGLAIWAGDGVETEFNLPTDEVPLYSGSTPEIWVSGTKQATPGYYSIDMDTGVITLVGALGNGTKMICLYQW